MAPSSLDGFKGGLGSENFRMRGWPILMRRQATFQMLEAFIQHLAPEGPVDCEDIFKRHRGNLREALWKRYDRASHDRFESSVC
jgi:hypothetical protein